MNVTSNRQQEFLSHLVSVPVDTSEPSRSKKRRQAPNLLKSIAALLAVPALASAVYAQEGTANCGTDLTPRLFASAIGDLDGDGTSDIANTVFNNAGDFTGVYVVGSASGSTLITFWPPVDELFFGVGVSPAGDFDGDGVPDIAIASVMDGPGDEAQGIVHVYSTVTGEEVAFIKDLSDSLVTLPDVKAVGDLDGNGVVDTTDLLLLLDSIATGTPQTDPYALDLNQDGIIDFADAILLMVKLGSTSSPTAAQTLATLINAGELTLNDPGFLGIEIPASYQPVQFGLFGCIGCSIKCAYYIKKASNCIGLRRQIAEDCAVLFPNVCSLEYTECIENGERTLIAACIDEVARTAGTCGKCVYKCVPKPSVR